MFSVTLFTVFAFVLTSFFQSSSAYVHALPRPKHHPPLHSIASRGPRQADAFLDAHNTIRALHNATVLTWSLSLAQKAEFWADQCQFRHTNGVLSDTQYGENIAAGTGVFTIPAAVGTFTSDQDKYDPTDPTYLRFTQVVWKSTTQLGCAVSQCNGIFNKSLGRTSLYVCLYDPVGNVIGKAPENVQI